MAYFLLFYNIDYKALSPRPWLPSKPSKTFQQFFRNDLESISRDQMSDKIVIADVQNFKKDFENVKNDFNRISQKVDKIENFTRHSNLANLPSGLDKNMQNVVTRSGDVKNQNLTELVQYFGALNSTLESFRQDLFEIRRNVSNEKFDRSLIKEHRQLQERVTTIQ